ncbi:flagellar protein FlaG [Aeromonas diversa CDC 2478-85]|uniref:Flagellar protein FlaG n=1 Tax=Aeromonas diversa CDC 2478-85 TaxID=1268237 RepID=N9VKS0_9GAMM|nr:flagellar protein FlaG [Aeromonas diversa]ENY71961.1 flagellar protein FlaG [Aeromonas diversa CDC 2478-85]
MASNVNFEPTAPFSGISVDKSGPRAASAHSEHQRQQDVVASESSLVVVKTPQTVTSQAELEKQAQELQELLKSKGWAVNYQIDEDLGRTIIRVMDSETQELIRQIPSEEMVNISKKLRSLEESPGDKSAAATRGLLFDERA